MMMSFWKFDAHPVPIERGAAPLPGWKNNAQRLSLLSLSVPLPLPPSPGELVGKNMPCSPQMYVYIYIHTYIHIYIYTHVYTHVLNVFLCYRCAKTLLQVFCQVLFAPRASFLDQSRGRLTRRLAPKWRPACKCNRR